MLKFSGEESKISNGVKAVKLSFIALVLKNIMRYRTRTILTVIGITVGIMTIVALTAIAEGLKSTIEKTLSTGGSDMSVFEKGTADAFFSVVKEGEVKKVKTVKGIADTDGQLWAIARTKDNPFFMLYGSKPKGFYIRSLDFIMGRTPQIGKGEIALGKVAFQNLKIKVGEKLKLQDKEFKLVGVYESGNIFEDGAGLIPLKDLQKMFKKEGQVTLVLVKLEKGANIKEVGKNIEKKFDTLASVTEVAEYAKVDQGTETVDVVAWGISLLSIIVGGIGVMNTMIMSVFERTREIGVLRAVGWRRWRIMVMILFEALIIGALGAILGIVSGVLAALGIASLPVARSFIEPLFNLVLFERALLVAVLIGILGGIFPALRASRLSPLEALRYE